MSKTIYLDAPDVGKMEKRFLSRAIDSGYVSTVGPYVPEFEKKFAKHLKVGSAVSTQSGTAALHVALYELGIGKGDEVIVPALTFVATVNPVLYVGARPVFADVDAATWNMDPEEIEKRITGKTKAIIPVHLYGNPCDMNRIMRIAKRHGLYVIEDATEALGSRYRGRYAGTFGDLGCFSFNGNKIATTGGGGMVVGGNKNRLTHIKFLVNQARDGSREYYHPEVGFNYRMTNVEAALGLAQMEKLRSFLEKKRLFNRIYRQELESVEFQEEYDGAESAWWLSCVVFKEGTDIPAVQKRLNSRRIPSRRIFMPLLEFPPYKKYDQKDYENTYRIYERGMCLPSSTLHSEHDIMRVCKAINEVTAQDN